MGKIEINILLEDINMFLFVNCACEMNIVLSDIVSEEIKWMYLKAVLGFTLLLLYLNLFIMLCNLYILY